MSQMEQGDEGMETRVEERSAELEREVQAWELLSHHLGRVQSGKKGMSKG